MASSGIGAGLTGVGTILSAYGDWMASQAEAAVERRNASFYEEQADFARRAGIRERMLFDRKSKVTQGQQLAGFAKSGGDISASSFFMATQSLYAQQESAAIQEEADFNERLALLRAQMSKEKADAIGDKKAFWLRTGAKGIAAAGSIL